MDNASMTIVDITNWASYLTFSDIPDETSGPKWTSTDRSVLRYVNRDTRVCPNVLHVKLRMLPETVPIQ